MTCTYLYQVIRLSEYFEKFNLEKMPACYKKTKWKLNGMQRGNIKKDKDSSVVYLKS